VKQTSEIFRAVSIYDAHCPHVDWPTWNAILDFTGRNRVDLLLWGGDNLDCGPISRHNKNKPLHKPRGQMKRDLDTFKEKMLDPIEALLPKDAKKVWLTGNHEDWLYQMIEEQPELEGLLDFAEYLKLTERGYEVKEQGGHYKHGHLKYIHGDVLSGGQTAPRKALDLFVESLVFGHFHAFASATKMLPQSAKYRWQSWATGCVGKLNASYLKNKPTGWMNGFNITEFYGRSGHFNHFPVTVFNGRFAYGGKLYGRH
jgi:hypothetical protein